VITLTDFWQGRDVTYQEELTDEIRANAAQTVSKANLLLNVFKAKTQDTEIRKVNSGWRPEQINGKTAGAAPRSKHMLGLAIDISDPEGDLKSWCMDNQDVLQDIGLWMEHPSACKGWLHVQVVPPKSQKRVFYP
jgi:hypothetical protein